MEVRQVATYSFTFVSLYEMFFQLTEDVKIEVVKDISNNPLETRTRLVEFPEVYIDRTEVNPCDSMREMANIFVHALYAAFHMGEKAYPGMDIIEDHIDPSSPRFSRNWLRSLILDSLVSEDYRKENEDTIRESRRAWMVERLRAQYVSGAV